MTTLPDHLESYLGLIAGGFSEKPEGERSLFNVVHFTELPIEGAHALVTLGVSHVPLRVKGKDWRRRQELMMMFRGEDGPGQLPSVLYDVAEQALGMDQSYALGDVIGPRGPLRPGASVEAVCVAPPVYLPDDFGVFEPENEAPILIAWLVPVTPAEAQFVRDQGWAPFDDLLEKHDPDLLDFRRASIV